MSLHKYIERLRIIDYHIRTKTTGNTEVLARRLGLSISSAYTFLDEMRDEGFPIRYSKKENRFYYEPKGRMIGYAFVKDTDDTENDSSEKSHASE